MHQNIYDLMGKMSILLLLCLVLGCDTSNQESSARYRQNEPYDADRLYAVIETPAGASVGGSYNFEKDRIATSSDTIDFLPYPGNYGFILRNEVIERSLDRNDHLSCLVLSSSITPLDVVEVYPIGVLSLESNANEEHVIICIPSQSELQSIKIKDFVDLMTQYEPVRFQIQHWFSNFMGVNKVHIKGWEDEEFAGHLIDLQEKKQVN